MSKELLDNVYTIKNAITYLKGNSYIKEDSYSMEALYHIEKALTPPTAEEVCKALSEFVGREVSYTNKQFHYIIKNTQVLIYVTETYNNKTFSLGVYLPPHLITLIGRFYEGEIK